MPDSQPLDCTTIPQQRAWGEEVGNKETVSNSQLDVRNDTSRNAQPAQPMRIYKEMSIGAREYLCPRTKGPQISTKGGYCDRYQLISAAAAENLSV
jgi:hypothetical protein